MPHFRAGSLWGWRPNYRPSGPTKFASSDVLSRRSACQPRAIVDSTAWVVMRRPLPRPAQRCSPDLLLRDLRLRDELDGAAAAAELARLHGCKVLIITGDPQNISSVAEVKTCGIVGKPWSNADLLKAVEERLRRATSTRAA